MAEPWDITAAFAQQLMRQAAAQDENAQQLALAPINQAMALERLKEQAAIEMQNLPRKLELQDILLHAPQQRRAADIATAARQQASDLGVEGYRKRQGVDIETWKTNPDYWRARRGGLNFGDTHTPRTPPDYQGTMAEDQLGLERDKMIEQGYEFSPPVAVGAKNFYHYRRKGWTPTTNPKVTTVPNPIPSSSQGTPVVPKLDEKVPAAGKGDATPTPPPRPTTMEDISNTLNPVPKETPKPEAPFNVPLTSNQGGTLLDSIQMALMEQGYSDQGARAIMAEMGRENSLDPSLIFGSHSDPYNRRMNIGALSWQGDRADALRSRLAQAGLLDERGMPIKSHDTMREYARFMKDEMGYMNPKLLSYLQQNDIDPEQAMQGLGRSYIKWRIDDPRYARRGKGAVRQWRNIIDNNLQRRVSTEPTDDPDIFDVLVA